MSGSGSDSDNSNDRVLQSIRNSSRTSLASNFQFLDLPQNNQKSSPNLAAGILSGVGRQPSPRAPSPLARPASFFGSSSSDLPRNSPGQSDTTSSPKKEIQQKKKTEKLHGHLLDPMDRRVKSMDRMRPTSTVDFDDYYGERRRHPEMPPRPRSSYSERIPTHFEQRPPSPFAEKLSFDLPERRPRSAQGERRPSSRQEERRQQSEYGERRRPNSTYQAEERRPGYKNEERRTSSLYDQRFDYDDDESYAMTERERSRGRSYEQLRSKDTRQRKSFDVIRDPQNVYWIDDDGHRPASISSKSKTKSRSRVARKSDDSVGPPPKDELSPTSDSDAKYSSTERSTSDLITSETKRPRTPSGPLKSSMKRNSSTQEDTSGTDDVVTDPENAEHKSVYIAPLSQEEVKKLKELQHRRISQLYVEREREVIENMERQQKKLESKEWWAGVFELMFSSTLTLQEVLNHQKLATSSFVQPKTLLMFRLFACVYCIIILGLLIYLSPPAWWKVLGDFAVLSWIGLIFYFLIATIQSISYCTSHNSTSAISPTSTTSRFLYLYFYAITVTYHLVLITPVYWSVSYYLRIASILSFPQDDRTLLWTTLSFRFPQSGVEWFVAVNIAGISTLLVAMELFLGRMPVVLGYWWLAVGTGGIYLIWTWILDAIINPRDTSGMWFWPFIRTSFREASAYPTESYFPAPASAAFYLLGLVVILICYLLVVLLHTVRDRITEDLTVKEFEFELPGRESAIPPEFYERGVSAKPSTESIIIRNI